MGTLAVKPSDITKEAVRQKLIQRATRDMLIRTWQIYDTLHPILFYAELYGMEQQVEGWIKEVASPMDYPINRNTFWRVKVEG